MLRRQLQVIPRADSGHFPRAQSRPHLRRFGPFCHAESLMHRQAMLGNPRCLPEQAETLMTDAAKYGDGPPSRQPYCRPAAPTFLTYKTCLQIRQLSPPGCHLVVLSAVSPTGRAGDRDPDAPGPQVKRPAISQSVMAILLPSFSPGLGDSWQIVGLFRQQVANEVIRELTFKLQSSDAAEINGYLEQHRAFASDAGVYEAWQLLERHVRRRLQLAERALVGSGRWDLAASVANSCGGCRCWSCRARSRRHRRQCRCSCSLACSLVCSRACRRSWAPSDSPPRRSERWSSPRSASPRWTAMPSSVPLRMTCAWRVQQPPYVPAFRCAFAVPIRGFRSFEAVATRPFTAFRPPFTRLLPAYRRFTPAFGRLSPPFTVVLLLRAQGGAAKRKLEQELIARIAEAAGVHPSQVRIKGFSQGSLIVEFEIDVSGGAGEPEAEVGGGNKQRHATRATD